MKLRRAAVVCHQSYPWKIHVSDRLNIATQSRKEMRSLVLKAQRGTNAFYSIVKENLKKEISPGYPPSQVEYLEQISFFTDNFFRNFIEPAKKNDSIRLGGEFKLLCDELKDLIKTESLPETWVNKATAWFSGKGSKIVRDCRIALTTIQREIERLDDEI